MKTKPKPKTRRAAAVRAKPTAYSDRAGPDGHPDEIPPAIEDTLHWTGPKPAPTEVGKAWAWVAKLEDGEYYRLRLLHPTAGNWEATPPCFTVALYGYQRVAVARAGTTKLDYAQKIVGKILKTTTDMQIALQFALEHSGKAASNADDIYEDAIRKHLADMPPSPRPAPTERVRVEDVIPDATKPRTRRQSEATEPTTDAAPKKKRQTLFNFSMGEILRWMSIDGWTIDEATKALNKLGCTPAPDTVRWQLKAGRVGGYGDPAKLTNQQIDQLYQAAESK